MKKRAASIVLVSAMGVGAVSGLALTPALAATAQQAASNRLTEIKNALKGLVSDGTLTQAQADKVATTLDSALPKGGPGGRGGHGGRGLIEDASTILGMTPEQIRTAMGTTQSLADVAATKGISKATLIDKLLADMDARVAADVKAGRITQAQADERKADAKAKVTEAVDRVGAPVRGDHDGPPPAAPSTTTPSGTATSSYTT
ncbi:MAG: hypothetical protein JWM40_2134 [Frankiales bacterium]|nr:hypothetical protein [Frankiales bacterium]